LPVGSAKILAGCRRQTSKSKDKEQRSHLWILDTELFCSPPIITTHNLTHQSTFFHKAFALLQNTITIITMKLSTLIASLCIASSAAFMPAPVAFRPSTLARQKLNDIDLMAIENVAEMCLRGDEIAMGAECDLEEHAALVNQLEDQRAILADHVLYIDSILEKLKGGVVDGEGAFA
jgi:hypothetical protein